MTRFDLRGSNVRNEAPGLLSGGQGGDELGSGLVSALPLHAPPSPFS